MRIFRDKIILVSILLFSLGFALTLFSSGNASESSLKSYSKNASKKIQDDFNSKAAELNRQLHEIKDKISAASEAEGNPFFTILNSYDLKNIRLSIRDSSGKILAWNKNFSLLLSEKLEQQNFFEQKPFVEDRELYTLISSKSSFVFKGKKYSIKISDVLEKKFSLHNKYANDVSFKKNLEKKYNVKLLIAYKKTNRIPDFINSFKLKTINGNGFTPVVYILSASNSSPPAYLFSIFFFLSGGIIFIFRFSRTAAEYFPKEVAALLTALFILLFRILIFYVFNDFTKLKGAFTNPVNFSSSFAWGLCSTPVSLFMTTLAGLAVAVILLRIISSDVTKIFLSKISKKILPVLAIIILILFLLLLRGFGASMRSMLFDSNIKLFNPRLAIFNEITLFHIFTILLVALTFTISLYALQLLLFTIADFFFSTKNRANAVIFTFALFAIALSFHFLERAPQTQIYVKFLLIFFLGHIIFWDYFNKQNLLRSSFIILIAASLFSTAVLQRQNKDLENALFKLISDKLANPNTFYFEELARTAANEITDKLERERLPINDAEVYSLWSGSFLPREAYSSFILIKKDSDKTAAFYYNWRRENSPTDITDKKDKAEITIPVKINDARILIKTGISWSDENIFSPSEPEFFITKKLAINSYLPAKNFLLFIFKDGKPIYNSHNISISNKLSQSMLERAKEKKRQIFDIRINGRNYVCYPVIKNRDGREIISIYTKEALAPLTFVFENLKIFFAQFIFSSILILLFFAYKRRDYKLRFTFRSALFILLLLTSIVPMILLAGYFRDLSDSKNLNSTSYKLRKRALQVEKYLSNHLAENDITKIITDAKRDLKVEFSIFSNGRLLGSTHQRFFDCGIISSFLNPEIVDFIGRSGLTEKLIKENIEKYGFNSFYKSASFGDEKIIISVNDAFNPILLPMSERELDIVLITIYSFAFILIILIGLFLINRITSPLQQLVEGTRKIAHGELDYKLDIKTFGELQDLINGFNLMSRKLKVSQEKLISAEREAAWREMAKQVAHEIKNPLTPMKLSVQQLIAAYKDGSPKFPKYFEKVTSSLLSQIELLSNIASEFSAFGKMPKINLEKINLAELLNELKPVFSDSEFSIEIHSENNSVFINSDKEYLGRVIVNFIRNAKESGARNVVFTIAEREKSVILEIENDGAEIPEEIKNRIFERSFTTKPDGMGIGLYLSKRFMEQSGGSVKLLRSDKTKTIFELKFN